MKSIKVIILLNLIFVLALNGQENQAQFLLNNYDLKFLKELTKDVMESSRIYPDQKISDGFGGNSTGGTLIRPVAEAVIRHSGSEIMRCRSKVVLLQKRSKSICSSLPPQLSVTRHGSPVPGVWFRLVQLQIMFALMTVSQFFIPEPMTITVRVEKPGECSLHMAISTSLFTWLTFM